LGGLTNLSPSPNPLERRLWGLRLFFGPLIWGPSKRGLYEEWVRVGPWARGQIDTSSCKSLLVHQLIFHALSCIRWDLPRQITVGGDGVVVGVNDDEVGPNGVGQDSCPSGATLFIANLIPYNPPEDRGLAYSPFERVVLNQLHDLNVAQDDHHKFCNARFQYLDEQITKVHPHLSQLYYKDLPSD